MIFYGPSGGDKGVEKSKLKNWNFSILIADSDSLQKSMNVKWSSFFLYSDFVTVKIKENDKVFRQDSNDDHLFANLDIFLDLSRDNI